jgi:superfamily II helicase
VEWCEKTHVPVLKECKHCREERHWTLFKRNSRNKDGLEDVCETCNKEELNGT